MSDSNEEDRDRLTAIAFDQLNPLLITSLQAAVPLWIEQFRSLSFEERAAIAAEAGQIVAEKGDRILYRSGKRGESAHAFNALARGIACCAFQPGGITIFGLRFAAHENHG